MPWKNQSKAFPNPFCHACLDALKRYGLLPIRCFVCGSDRQITNWIGPGAEKRLKVRIEEIPGRPKPKGLFENS